MKCIVTGGAGFIGSRLVKRLVLEGNEVLAIDNLHSGNTANLTGIDCSFFKVDSKRIDIAGVVPDVIFHLGMYSASAYYNEDPQLMAEVVDGAIAVFEFALKHNAKVVVTSTSSVYHGLEPPHYEAMTLNVAGLYTEGRIAMERLARFYHDRHGLKTVALRPFSVYGAGSECKGKYANIANRFLLNIIGKDHPVTYGGGSARRDFVDVNDVVWAFMRAARVDLPDFEVFNVGTGKAWSINQLKDKIEKVVGRRPEAPSVPVPPTYPAITCADTMKAESLLGFRAAIDLDEGLHRLVDYYKALGIGSAV